MISSSFNIVVIVLQAIRIAFGPFILTNIVSASLALELYGSINRNPLLHLHFDAHRKQPLFRLKYSVTLEGRPGNSVVMRFQGRDAARREKRGILEAAWDSACLFELDSDVAYQSRDSQPEAATEGYSS